jgi:uncharacterized membrane protein YGL010W
LRILAKDLIIYRSFHTKLITQITHYIGIPLVSFALLILFSWIHIRIPGFFDTTLAWLLSVLIIIYYIFLDLYIGATVSIVLIILNLIAAYITHNAPSWHGFKLFLIIFAIGALCQIIGHWFEGRKPALARNLKYALIGPLFLVAEIFFCFGFKKDLQQQITEKQ